MPTLSRWSYECESHTEEKGMDFFNLLEILQVVCNLIGRYISGTLFTTVLFLIFDLFI